jgi:hypothetical protein
MTTTESTALAVREYSDSAIKTRMKLNQQAGYGLEKASPAQLNIVFLLCQRYQLDPVSDLTLFEGRPFITIDGRLRLLRRHPDYRGYACRPLLKDEKVAWGFEPEDIVVECVIRTATWGEISARGRVAATEVEGARERARQSGRKAAPIGTHPVEIAEKRAIARAERAAFGQEAVLDDEEIEEATHVVIAERNDPARVAAGAAAYDRIIAPNYDDDLPDERAEVQPAGAPTPAAEPEDADLVQVARERNESACKEAEEIGVKGVKQLRWAKTDAIEDIERKTFEAEERTRSRNNEIDADLAAQGSGQAAFS